MVKNGVPLVTNELSKHAQVLTQVSKEYLNQGLEKADQYLNKERNDQREIARVLREQQQRN